MEEARAQREEEEDVEDAEEEGEEKEKRGHKGWSSEPERHQGCSSELAVSTTVRTRCRSSSRASIT